MSDRGPGKPPFEPTDKDRRTVRAMAAYGIKQHEIAAVIGVHDDTLRKHFRAELDTAGPEFQSRIMERLANIALNGEDRSSVPACIFLAKARFGMRETVRHEGGDTPVQLRIISGVGRGEDDVSDD